jgi:hypothetical protein
MYTQVFQDPLTQQQIPYLFFLKGGREAHSEEFPQESLIFFIKLIFKETESWRSFNLCMTSCHIYIKLLHK